MTGMAGRQSSLAWYDGRREHYLKEARDYLNEEATNDEIDDEIENELEAWND